MGTSFDLPRKMRAIVVSSHGGPDVLVPADWPEPKPAPDEVAVRTTAIGVNALDATEREGRRAGPVPFVPGHEGAGAVIAVGSDVSDLSPGDRVAWACPTKGASYAEIVAVPAKWVARLPRQIDDVTAAAVLIQGMTAHYLTFDTHPVVPGDTFLVHGGAGGVGLMLIQMVKANGGRVIATVATEEKDGIARQFGADVVIRYDKHDFAPEVLALTNGEGVAAVYDGVGAATFDGNLACVSERGVVAIYGQASGPVASFDTTRLVAAGSIFLTRTSLVHHAATRREFLDRAEYVLDGIVDGTLRVHIGGQFALEHAGEAHRQLAARERAGKLVLTP